MSLHGQEEEEDIGKASTRGRVTPKEQPGEWWWWLPVCLGLASEASDDVGPCEQVLVQGSPIALQQLGATNHPMEKEDFQRCFKLPQGS